jgi:fatty-acyl-CoA synthase
MTAVGKIFKPALQQLEVEETVREQAKRVGATITDVKAERDARIGMIARVGFTSDM